LSLDNIGPFLPNFSTMTLGQAPDETSQNTAKVQADPIRLVQNLKLSHAFNGHTHRNTSNVRRGPLAAFPTLFGHRGGFALRMGSSQTEAKWDPLILPSERAKNIFRSNEWMR
jgi:hypothetical protein